MKQQKKRDSAMNERGSAQQSDSTSQNFLNYVIPKLIHDFEKRVLVCGIQSQKMGSSFGEMNFKDILTTSNTVFDQLFGSLNQDYLQVFSIQVIRDVNCVESIFQNVIEGFRKLINFQKSLFSKYLEHAQLKKSYQRHQNLQKQSAQKVLCPECQQLTQGKVVQSQFLSIKYSQFKDPYNLYAPGLSKFDQNDNDDDQNEKQTWNESAIAQNQKRVYEHVSRLKQRINRRVNEIVEFVSQLDKHIITSQSIKQKSSIDVRCMNTSIINFDSCYRQIMELLEVKILKLIQKKRKQHGKDRLRFASCQIGTPLSEWVEQFNEKQILLRQIDSKNKQIRKVRGMLQNAQKMVEQSISQRQIIKYQFNQCNQKSLKLNAELGILKAREQQIWELLKKKQEKILKMDQKLSDLKIQLYEQEENSKRTRVKKQSLCEQKERSWSSQNQSIDCKSGRTVQFFHSKSNKNFPKSQNSKKYLNLIKDQQSQRETVSKRTDENEEHSKLNESINNSKRVLMSKSMSRKKVRQQNGSSQTIFNGNDQIITDFQIKSPTVSFLDQQIQKDNQNKKQIKEVSVKLLKKKSHKNGLKPDDLTSRVELQHQQQTDKKLKRLNLLTERIKKPSNNIPTTNQLIENIEKEIKMPKGSTHLKENSILRTNKIIDTFNATMSQLTLTKKDKKDLPSQIRKYPKFEQRKTRKMGRQFKNLSALACEQDNSQKIEDSSSLNNFVLSQITTPNMYSPRISQRNSILTQTARQMGYKSFTTSKFQKDKKFSEELPFNEKEVLKIYITIQSAYLQDKASHAKVNIHNQTKRILPTEQIRFITQILTILARLHVVNQQRYEDIKQLFLFPFESYFMQSTYIKIQISQTGCQSMDEMKIKESIIRIIALHNECPKQKGKFGLCSHLESLWLKLCKICILKEALSSPHQTQLKRDTVLNSLN